MFECCCGLVWSLSVEVGRLPSAVLPIRLRDSRGGASSSRRRFKSVLFEKRGDLLLHRVSAVGFLATDELYDGRLVARVEEVEKFPE